MAARSAQRGPGATCLALFLVLGACASSDPQRPVQPGLDLRDPDPRRRTEAAQAVAERGDRRWIPDLIEMLDDRDESVRLVAGAALRELTGRDTGYQPFGTPEARRAQVLEWRRWYDQGAGSDTQPPPPPLPPPPATGRTP